MVSSSYESLIYDLKILSSVPATMTEPDIIHELSNMDLIMKLHYLRGIYFFEKEAAGGLTGNKIRESMFYWLDQYYITCGRVKLSETGAPFIRCNDAGVRLIEAKCIMRMDEFLELKDCGLQNSLFYDQVMGPELQNSPLVIIQVTFFKCGGLSIGLRWSHVLGDAFSCTEYINKWAQVLGGQHQAYKSPGPIISQVQMKSQAQMSSSPQPVKHVETVGDYWFTPNNCKMGTFYFEIPTAELQANLSGRIPCFVYISAVIWCCLGTIRQETDPSTVTICKSHKNGYLGNNPILSVVKAEFQVANSEPFDLADLIMGQNVNVTSQIGSVIGKDDLVPDYVMYGANPTFVDLEGVNLYGLELNGLKPVFANYMIHGVGDAGVIVVLPNADGGRTVSVTVPENEVSLLKSEMGKKWNIII